MRDSLDTVQKMAWEHTSHVKHGHLGLFSVKLPDHPDSSYTAKPISPSREHAITLFCTMVFNAMVQVEMNTKERDRLDTLARSIYSDLTEAETALANKLLGYEV